MDLEADKNYTNHSISLGKGVMYLTFKLSSQRYLYLMATCQFNQFFDPVTYECMPCNPAHHSFGLQEEVCYPCNSMYHKSRGDNVKQAIYTQKCTDGEFKAMTVIIGSGVLVLLLGVVCCMRNRFLEKKLRMAAAEEKKQKATERYDKIAQKLTSAMKAKVQEKLDESNAEIARKRQNFDKQFEKAPQPETKPLTQQTQPEPQLKPFTAPAQKPHVDKSLELSAIQAEIKKENTLQMQRGHSRDYAARMSDDESAEGEVAASETENEDRLIL